MDIYLETMKAREKIQKLKTPLEPILGEIKFLEEKIKSMQCMCSHSNSLYGINGYVGNVFHYTYRVECPDCGVSWISTEENIKNYKYTSDMYSDLKTYKNNKM